MPDLQALTIEIEEFASFMMKDCKPTNTGQKIINEPVWGTNFYYPWEVNILDLPLLQRLRYIHQTTFAYLIYPTAFHRRFDHSLGVVAAASKMFRHLEYYNQIREVNHLEPRISLKPTDLQELRLAAMLHDVGHSFFSHISEAIYERIDPSWKAFQTDLDDIEAKKEKKDPKYKPVNFQKPASHEMLSYLIVRSKAFRKYFSKLCKLYNINLDLDNVANYILGHSDDPKKYFLAEIINGPIDADKLDYLRRDGYFAGLPLAYDLDRLMFFLRVAKSGGRYRLVIDLRCIPAIDQFINNRLTLYGRIYHHQKINAADCMFMSYIMTIHNEKAPVHGKLIGKPTDFLYITDDQIMTFQTENPRVKHYQDAFRKRSLYKRALKIGYSTISRGYSEGRISKGRTGSKEVEFIRLYKDIDKVDLVRKRIYDELPKRTQSNLSIDDIWLFVPRRPAVDETKQLGLLTADGLKDFDEVSKLGKWVESYNTHQWAGYVYTLEKYVKPVNKASIKVLKDMFDLEFTPIATEACKII